MLFAPIGEMTRANCDLMNVRKSAEFSQGAIQNGRFGPLNQGDRRTLKTAWSTGLSKGLVLESIFISPVFSVSKSVVVKSGTTSTSTVFARIEYVT